MLTLDDHIDTNQKVPKSQVRLLRLSYYVLERFLLRDLEGARDPRIITQRFLKGLPKDASLSAVALDPVNKQVVFRVVSSEYEPVPPGVAIPEVSVEYTETVPPAFEIGAMVCRTLQFHQDDVVAAALPWLRKLGHSGAEAQAMAHGIRQALRTAARFFGLDPKED